MKRLLIDTNIMLDILAKRHPFYQPAAMMFTLADRNKIELYISSLSIANTNYVLSRFKPPSESKEILRRFKVLVNILSLDEKIINLALNDSKFKDFEDGLQYYSAIENDIGIIITRNLSDFKESIIPAMTPAEFLASFEKS